MFLRGRTELVLLRQKTETSDARQKHPLVVLVEYISNVIDDHGVEIDIEHLVESEQLDLGPQSRPIVFMSYCIHSIDGVQIGKAVEINTF